MTPVRLIAYGVAALVVLGLLGGLYAKGRADGKAVEAAIWSARYDALIAATNDARVAEQARQTAANEAARIEADRLVNELEAARNQSSDLSEELRRERAQDAASSPVCGSLDSVMRYNRSIGRPAPTAPGH